MAACTDLHFINTDLHFINSVHRPLPWSALNDAIAKLAIKDGSKG